MFKWLLKFFNKFDMKTMNCIGCNKNVVGENINYAGHKLYTFKCESCGFEYRHE